MSAHRDKAKAIIAEISRASGLSFRSADRLTRGEAERVIAWGQGSPEFMAAYTSAAHPGHAEAQIYSTWPFFFLHDFPQTPEGEPVDWSEVRTVDDDAADDAKTGDDFDPFKGWTAEQARERIQAATKDPKYQEFRDARDDRSHPDHPLAQREFTRLHEIAYPEQPTKPSPGVSPAGGAAASGSGTPAAGSTSGAPADRASALRRIGELYRDAEFLKRSESPDRQVREAATAEAAGLFSIAYPEPAPERADSGGAAPAGGDGPS